MGLLFAIVSVPLCWAAEPVPIGAFSQSGLDGWEPHEFIGETRYRLVSVDGRTVLRADSQQSASALVYRMRIDLRETPVLNWSWRKIREIDPGDESQKPGDDFVARIYVIRDGGLFFWNARALNYVWSFSHQQGDVWDNPFAGHRAKMMSLRDADDPAKEWFHEQRDVAADLRQVFGEDFDYIDGVAIMTDSDNSGLRAGAEYGDIFFSAGPVESTR